MSEKSQIYDSKIRQDFFKAVMLSTVTHILILQLGYLYLQSDFGRPKQVVYSISLESGRKKGGVAQIPDKKAEKMKPPPEKKKEEVPVKTKKKKIAKKVEKKDVELAAKVKKVVKPKPTPKPTVKPKPTPKPTVKPKPTPKPVKKKPKPPKKADYKKEFEERMKRYLGESTNAGGVGFGSAGRGGVGMGGGLRRSPEWFLYKDKLESYVKRGWNWHDPEAALVAVVSFRISPAGIISGVKLVSGSGNSLYDDSVIRAVQKASPVPPAPPKLYREFSFVEMDFRPE